MVLHLLVTRDLRPIPDDVKVEADWGELQIITNDRTFVHGDHMMVSATKESFARWLGRHDGFWLGSGSPMMQKFDIAHIKDSLVASVATS